MRWSGGGRTARASLLCAVVAVAVSTVPFMSQPVAATSIVPFSPVFTANDNGSIAVFGNNLMVCPAAVADCQATRNGTTNKNNNNYNMVHLDVDGATFPTFSSSAAAVVLPPESEVRWAGLYWGARLGTGTAGAAAIGNGQQMKLRAPGDGAYRTITASRPLFGPTTTPDRAYQGFADVTALVQQAGPGVYTGADVSAATGQDRYSGWSLVVVYRSSSLPLRNLTVFHGLADVGQNDPQSITITGFRTPVSGPVNTRIGLIAYEGDRGSSGDRAVLEGTLLATSLSQGTNFFNGANDDNGTLVTTRDPADRNMLGFDIKNFDAPGILANNASSARIDLASTSERYFPGVVTTAIDVFAPDFSPSTKSVTNLTGGNPARVGDRLRYTVTFVNGGQDPAINTSIADPIPAGTTYVPDSLVVPGGVTGSFDSAANTVRVLPGNFPVGRSMTFSFDVDVGSGAAGGDLSNRAVITYDGATLTELQDLTFATRAATIAVAPSADLVVTKVNTPPTVIAGGVVTSTITVRNDGPNESTDVLVTDEFPAGVTSTATSSQGSCTTGVESLTCQIGTVAAGATITVTVTTNVPPDSLVASLTDVARVASSTSDPDPSNNTAPATSDVARDANLSIVKSPSPTTVTPGGNVTYTITVTNNGPSTATAVAISDELPDPSVALTAATSPGATCVVDPDSARCTLPSLAPGAAAVMTVIGEVAPDAVPASIVTNAASVSSATPDSVPTDNSVTAQITVGARVTGLTVTKTADAPDPLVAGSGEVQYTLDITNAGPSDASPVALTDVLPAGFEVSSATTDRGTCAVAPEPTGDTVSCAVGTLTAPFARSPGARARITITASVPATVPAGTYPNTATVTAPDSSVQSNNAPVTVSALANVSVIKSFPEGSPVTDITPGASVTYRIRVVNAGPSVAADTVITDTLPPGLTSTAFRVVSFTPPPGGTPVCAATTCDLGDLPPNAAVELELDVFVDPGLVIDPAVGVANTASVTTATTDPVPADNTSTFTVSGAAQADLSIRKIPPPTDPVAGLNTSYILEVINFGPSDAPDIVITDQLPPGMTFVRVFDPTMPEFPFPQFCTVAGDPELITCPFPVPFPAFVGTNLGIEVAVAETIPDGTALLNTASLSSSVLDGNTGNNNSSAVVNVRAVANLTTTKLAFEYDSLGNPIGPVPAGEVLELPAGHAVGFILRVTNTGDSAAADVQVIDTFELDGGNFPDPRCAFLNDETVCRYTNPATSDLLLPGQTFEVQLLTIPFGNTPQGVYTNQARASTTTPESSLADNTDSVDIEIVEPVADLIIGKSAVTSPLVAGETFTYQIAVQAGIIDVVNGVLRLSSDAENVVVTDSLPPGLVPTSATTSQGSCTVVAQAVSCALGTLGSPVTLEPVLPALITVTGTVAPDAQPNVGSNVVNTAVATSSTALRGGGASRSATATTPLERRADLAVTKTADATSVAAGGGITFTVTVTNTGPSDALGVEVTDLLPAPLVYAAAGSDASCSLVAGNVVCALGTLAAGTTRSITLAATVPSGAVAGPVTNTVSVESDVIDPDGTDNVASVPVDVTRTADLSVTKTAASEGVLLGGTIAYTLAVANQGPSDAIDVILTESIPTGTTVATLPPGCTAIAPGTIECALGTIAAGASITIDIVVSVPDTLTPGALGNTASVRSDTADTDQSNNTATATVEAVAQADVTLTKELVTSDPIAGEPLEYRLTLVNNGPTVAPNASLSDAIPIGTTFVSFAASQGTCQLDEVEDVPAASCNLGRIAVGGTATATLIVATNPDAVTVSNTGFGGSGGLDEIPADNEDTVTTSLRRIVDLSVVKTGPATVSAAAPAEYVITYRNDGISTAPDALVTDTLPAGLTPRALAGCVIAATTISCAVGPVAPGATGSLTITADVDPALAIGTALTDVATIASNTQGVTDSNPANDTAQFTSTVEAQNDVGVTVVADQDVVRVGERASYTVVVVNNGPQVANNVVLTNVPPPELVDVVVTNDSVVALPLVLLSLPPGCVATDTTVVCQLGNLAVGESRRFVFGGIVAVGTPVSARLVHSATVSLDGVDSVVANNADADAILIIAAQVVPPPTPDPTPVAPPTGRLPVTGSTVGLWLALGLLLMVSGFALRRTAGRPRPANRAGARR